MARFEFNMRIPADRALAAMIRDVVAHGARQAGASDDQALDFGCRCEDTVRDLTAHATPDRPVAVVIHIADGPLLVAITGGAAEHTFTLDI